MSRKTFCVLGCLCLSGPLLAQPSAIPGLFPTGIDQQGQPIERGGADPHYLVLETATQAVASATHPAWVGNDTTSRWIWQLAGGGPVDVIRTFRLTFDLTGFDPGTAQIQGVWAADNTGLDIWINGIPTGNTNPIDEFGFVDFEITGGFAARINTLDFVVEDVGTIAGFRVGGIFGTAVRRCPGDTDGDDDVDLTDLATVLAEFGQAGAALVGDVDYDDDVDLGDLALVLAAFGETCL